LILPKIFSLREAHTVVKDGQTLLIAKEETGSLTLLPESWTRYDVDKFLSHYRLKSGDIPGAICVRDEDFWAVGLQIPFEDKDREDPEYGDLHYSFQAISLEKQQDLADLVAQLLPESLLQEYRRTQ